MSSMVPLLSDGQITSIGLLTVGSTLLLTSFALFSEPDGPLILLLCVSFAANYAWIQHIDSGWGSENALTMFKASMAVGLLGLVGGVYRRWRYPELIVVSDDEDEDEDGGAERRSGMARVSLGAVEDKKALMADVRRRSVAAGGGGVDRKHLARHMHVLNEVKGREEGKGREEESHKKEKQK